MAPGENEFDTPALNLSLLKLMMWELDVYGLERELGRGTPITQEHYPPFIPNPSIWNIWTHCILAFFLIQFSLLGRLFSAAIKLAVGFLFPLSPVLLFVTTLS